MQLCPQLCQSCVPEEQSYDSYLNQSSRALHWKPSHETTAASSRLHPCSDHGNQRISLSSTTKFTDTKPYTPILKLSDMR